MDSVYDKIRFLVRYLNECTKAYDEGHPKITDEEWDNKYFELQELEKETGLILSNSPTQSISYEIVNALNKVEHSHKMLSLDKTKSSTEVKSFIGNKTFLAMCKMDGLTCSLTYRNGELVSAETRGNGLIGEDILHNIKTLSSVPKKIPYIDELVIDGEIICTYTDFKPFSSEYKNPRNFAAGSIRLLDAKECARRNLTFVVWDILTEMYFDDGIEYRLDQKLDYLKPFGFIVVPYIGAINGMTCSEKQYDDFINELQIQAKELGFPIDGVVFKFADCAYGRSLGETTHHFKNALAYKFYDETYWSKLLDIEWSMGRTGVLTPVAIFEPIDMDGSIVERASLHNVSIMSDLFGSLGPCKGDEVEVFKANMIIPQIKSVKNVCSHCEEYQLHIPKVCPVCGGAAAIKDGIDSLNLVCLETNCPGKLINRLDHFCGKKGLDIKGVSKATLEKLIDWGWLNDYTDIFKLSSHRGEWIQKPGFGVKSVEKILDSINTGANCELHQFIAALGIPLIGSTASKELAKHFKTWDEFIEAAENSFAFYSLPNFGSEMHNNLISFNYVEAKLLVNYYIHFDISKVLEATLSGNNLTGKTFVITGKLTQFKNRDELKLKIENLGGKVTGSVSRNTDYLINNDIESTSSKNLTAKSLGIPILSEIDFIQTFGIV